MKRTAAILPGSTLGVLGSGQLGRMFALAARGMGYRVHVFSPDAATPAGAICDQEIRAAYDDAEALKRFAESVDVVTFEFENVPAASLELLETLVPVRPGKKALHIAQNRLREKRFLSEAGFTVAPFRQVRDQRELEAAVEALGLPAVLKTAGFGYDGKGQETLRERAQVAGAFARAAAPELVLERFVDFDCEVSVIVARGPDGSMADWSAFENRHEHHILDVTVVPSSIPNFAKDRARTIANSIAEKIDLVGLLCVEFFVTKAGELIVNELAPRPHNSGHLTINACLTSQFEQQVRAVCGLPLGSTSRLRPAAMANLLGDVWAKGEPDWAAALAVSPEVSLHLYGKKEPRPGRKMGHLTALADSAEEAVELVKAARAALVK